MSFSQTVAHLLPVHLDADGVTLDLPSDFRASGSLEESSSTIHEAHLRGRRLVGKSFQFPDDAEALILRCDGGNDLEEEAVSLKPVTSGGGIVKKLVIWNTDAPSDVNESIQSALLWAKLSGAIKKTD